MPQQEHLKRAPGLDTLRAVAIALVLMTHYAGFVSGAHTFGVLDEVGWAGVDLFFVLSGYLIGNQIFSAMARGEDFSLKRFFAKRLLRTLPNYYVVLALVLPLVALGVASCKRAVTLAWCIIAAAIAAGMAARGAGWLSDGHNAFAAETYYSTLCRADELLPGVGIAMLKNFHAALYHKILRQGNVLLGAGFAAVVAVLYFVQHKLPSPFLATTLGFSLLAMSYALLVLAALSPHSLLGRTRVPGAASVALWSYAVYLMHKPIFMLVAPQLHRLNIDTNAPVTVMVMMAGAVCGGWLLFRLVETPFMQLRARWYPAARPADGLALAA